MQSARVRNFLPTVSGFAFANAFHAEDGVPDITINLGAPFPPIAIGDASNGVCGGMVYAAMDAFLCNPRQHIPIARPAADMPPAKADPLTVFIGQRLFDSFGPAFANVFRYLDLMSTIDHDTDLAEGVGSVIVKHEWPKIKADIDANVPSPLGLVPGAWVWPTNIAAKVGLLGHSHQVLAWGYDLDDAANLTLHVYDPNNPGNDLSVIQLNIGSPAHTTMISAPDIVANIKGHHPFRAFFRHGGYVSTPLPAGASSGAFAIAASIAPGGSLPAERQITITVVAKDAAPGGAPLANASVLIGGVRMAAANQAFSTTFNSKYVRARRVDPRTHANTWYWAGPSFPSIQVTAPNYETVGLRPTFSGVNPPPQDDPEL